MVQASWESVTPDTVSNCFNKAGFTLQPADEVQDEGEVHNDDVSLEFLNTEEPTTFDDYVSCDNDLQCAPMISVEDIVTSFDPSATAQDDEVDDFGDPLPRVSIQQANSAF